MSGLKMKAVVYKEYGEPGVLKLQEVDKPLPGNNEVLIKVKASSVNSADWRLRRAEPFLVRFIFGFFKPKINILGVTFAGIVEETGNQVSNFRKGDKVFGMNDKTLGAHAEYLCVPGEGVLAKMPENLTFSEAAVIPFGATTAYVFLKKAELQKGEKILIYGASGAVGTAAVQIAKHLGAEVTAVCSSDNKGMVTNLGADRVIDYTKEDVYKSDEQYDVIFETVDKADVMKLAALLKKGGKLILGSALVKGAILGQLAAFKSKVKVLIGETKPAASDMELIRQMAEAGHLKPIIDRTYSLEQLPEAHAYVERGHKKGNVAVMVSS